MKWDQVGQVGHGISTALSTSVKLLTKQHLEFLSLKGGCIGMSEYINVKMPHCWKSLHGSYMVLLYEAYGQTHKVLVLIVLARGEATDNRA